MKLTPVVLSSLLACVAATPVSKEAAHQQHHILDSNWEKQHGLGDETHIPVRIALKQRNLENAADYLLEV